MSWLTVDHGAPDEWCAKRRTAWEVEKNNLGEGFSHNIALAGATILDGYRVYKVLRTLSGTRGEHSSHREIQVDRPT